jgi:thymidylate synthase (FAD)
MVILYSKGKPMSEEKEVSKPQFRIHNPKDGSWTKGRKIEILSSYSEEEKPGCATSYVELIDYLGTELTVVNAARVSFGKEKYEFDKNDARLVAFLARNHHWTPFSQIQLQFRIHMPIFVARQYFKHQIGLTRNEISRRYVTSTPSIWLPKEYRQSAENVKQGSSNLIHPDNTLLIDMAYQAAKDQIMHYEALIQAGVCAEQARTVLPMSVMTEFIETGSLAAYMRICELREEKTAQKEIQEFAIAIGMHCKALFPHVWEALKKEIPAT